MQYRKDKRGVDLSILGFGCMRFKKNSGKIDMQKAEELIMKAYDNGVNYYDTAYIYPGSEVALGEIVEKNDIRDKIYIASKLPQFLCNNSESFDKYFDEQKERLRTDYIDYYLIHSISLVEQWTKLCELGIEDWIAKKISSGEIKQIGFSYHGNESDFMTLLDAYDWDFVQIQYNYINIKYQAGRAGLKRAAEKGIPVVVMEPLLGGRLANDMPKEALEIMKTAEPKSTAASWALKWLWNQPEVTLILSGMNEMAQVDENIDIAEKSSVGMMSDEQEKVIEKVIDVFDKYYKIKCTGCNYCMPCPQKIDIPGAFSVYNNNSIIGWRQSMVQYMNSVGALGDNPKFLSECTECGRCEKECPQHIPIIKELKKVRRKYEFPGVKPVVRLVRWASKKV